MLDYTVIALKTGTFLAIRTEFPKFCFVRDSREDAVAAGERALCRLGLSAAAA